MRLAVIAVLAVLLAGCIQTQTRTAYRLSGTMGGQPVELTAAGAEASDTGVDPLAVVQAGLAALRGDVAGVAAAVAAQPPPPPPLDPADVAAAVAKATPPPAPPATVTGSGMVDSLLAALVAYLTGRGGIAVAGRLKTKKVHP